MNIAPAEATPTRYATIGITANGDHPAGQSGEAKYGGSQRNQILRNHEPPTEPLQPSDLWRHPRGIRPQKVDGPHGIPRDLGRQRGERVDDPDQLEADESGGDDGEGSRPGAQGGRRDAGGRHEYRIDQQNRAASDRRRAEPHALPRAEDRSDEGGSPDTSCHGRLPRQRQQQQHRAFERHVDRGRKAADDRAGNEREGEDASDRDRRRDRNAGGAPQQQIGQTDVQTTDQHQQPQVRDRRVAEQRREAGMDGMPGSGRRGKATSRYKEPPESNVSATTRFRPSSWNRNAVFVVSGRFAIVARDRAALAAINPAITAPSVSRRASTVIASIWTSAQSGCR